MRVKWMVLAGVVVVIPQHTEETMDRALGPLTRMMARAPPVAVAGAQMVSVSLMACER